MLGRNKLHRFLGVGVAASCLAATAGVLVAAPAHATTGNADGLPEPKILVNPAIGDSYIGRFYLSRIQRSAGLVSAVLDVDYTESTVQEFLVGDGEFYQYNKQGKLTSWTASLYPYVYKDGLLSCNLLVPGTTDQVLGRLVLNKPQNRDTPAHPNQEKISGKLTIAHTTYVATFRQVEDDRPPPTVLPRAVQTGSAKSAQASSASQSATRVNTAASSGDSARDAGVYASVVQLVQSLG